MSQSPFWKSCCDAYQKIIFMDNFIILLGLLTQFNFVLVLSHYIATYYTHFLLFIISLSQVWCFFCIHHSKWLTFDSYFIVVRFDDSIGGILLSNNNESDNPYLFFMNPFLSSKTRVFLSEERLDSYRYALTSSIFYYYLVSGSAYIFLYFFFSNSKLFDRLLGKGWWYTSSVRMVILLECI